MKNRWQEHALTFVLTSVRKKWLRPKSTRPSITIRAYNLVRPGNDSTCDKHCLHHSRRHRPHKNETKVVHWSQYPISYRKQEVRRPTLLRQAMLLPYDSVSRLVIGTIWLNERVILHAFVTGAATTLSPFHFRCWTSVTRKECADSSVSAVCWRRMDSLTEQRRMRTHFSTAPRQFGTRSAS